MFAFITEMFFFHNFIFNYGLFYLKKFFFFLNISCKACLVVMNSFTSFLLTAKLFMSPILNDDLAG